MNRLIASATVAVATMLVACGGGGSSSTGGASLTSAPVAAAFNTVFTTPQTYTAHLTTNSAVALNMTFAQGAATTLNGVQAKTLVISSTITQGNSVLGSSTVPVIYTVNPLQVEGYSGRLTSTTSQLPASANVGASGPFFSATMPGAGLSTVQGVGTWLVQPANSGSWVCFNMQIGPGLTYAAAVTETTIETLCFLSDANGNISGFQASFQDNGQSTNTSTIISTSVYQ